MARRFLLDTHVVVDIGTKDGFEAMPWRVQRILEEAELLLSVASEVEVAVKSRIGKLELTKDKLAIICINASITSYRKLAALRRQGKGHGSSVKLFGTDQNS